MNLSIEYIGGAAAGDSEVSALIRMEVEGESMFFTAASTNHAKLIADME